MTFKITPTYGSSQRRSDLIALVTLFLAGLIYTFQMTHFLDIGLMDESNYLWGWNKPILEAQNGPLYSLWYRLLTVWAGDTVVAYFWNMHFVMIGLPMVLYVALRSYRVMPLIAVMVCLLVLRGYVTFGLGTKSAQVCMMLFLLGLILCSQMSKLYWRWLVMALVSLVMSYVRPEFFISFALSFLIFAGCLIAHFKKSASLKDGIAISIIVLGMLWCIETIGIPLAGGRSFLAFGQHYAVHWVSWHNDLRNPWTNWDDIVKLDFGGATSITQAALANPMAISRHILTNLKDFIPNVAGIFIGSYPFQVIPIALMLCGILVSIALVIASISRGGVSHWLKLTLEQFHQEIFLLGVVFVCVFPVVGSTLLISPRLHYALLFGLPCLFMLVVNQSRVFALLNLKINTSQLVMCAVSISVLLSIRPLSAVPPPSEREVSKIIYFIRALNIAAPVNMLEADGGFFIYLTPNYAERVAEYEKSSSFDSFMREKMINMIVVSPTMNKDIRFTHDHQWQDFLANPAQKGFTAMTIPQVSGYTLLVDKKLLAK
jgi:hypothetical protein